MGKVVQYEVGDVFLNGSLDYKILSKEFINCTKSYYYYEVDCGRCREKYPSTYPQMKLNIAWGYGQRLSHSKGTLKVCPCSRGYIWKEECLENLVKDLMPESTDILERCSPYEGLGTRFKFSCPLHGKGEQSVRQILKYEGCGKCSAHRKSLSRTEGHRKTF